MRYWRIMPEQPIGERFDPAWSYDLANNTIAIGWCYMGDISKLVDDEKRLADVCRDVYGERSDEAQEKICRLLLRFYSRRKDGVAEGDQIVACRGTSEIVGIGTVCGSAYYDESKGRRRTASRFDDFNSNFLPVAWESRTRLVFPSRTLPRSTMTHMPAARFHELMAQGKRGD